MKQNSCSYEGEARQLKATRQQNKESVFFVVSLISKLRWNMKTLTSIQTRLKSMRLSGKL